MPQFIVDFYVIADKPIKSQCKIDASNEEYAISCFFNSVKAGNNGNVSNYKIIEIKPNEQ